MIGGDHLHCDATDHFRQQQSRLYVCGGSYLRNRLIFRCRARGPIRRKCFPSEPQDVVPYFLHLQSLWYSSEIYTVPSHALVAKMPSNIVTTGVVALLGLSWALGSSALANTNPCTFRGSDGYQRVNETKNSCSTIILDSLDVPAGETLDLENLNDGTTVTTPIRPLRRPHDYSLKFQLTFITGHL